MKKHPKLTRRQPLKTVTVIMNCNHASYSLQSSKPASQHTFSSVTYGDVDRVIKNLANKSCELDLWPTWLLRQNLDIVVCNITNIVNLLISEGTFPMCLKQGWCDLFQKRKVSRATTFKL